MRYDESGKSCLFVSLYVHIRIVYAHFFKNRGWSLIYRIFSTCSKMRCTSISRYGYRKRSRRIREKIRLPGTIWILQSATDIPSRVSENNTIELAGIDRQNTR